jgi:hypothetical protein
MRSAELSALEGSARAIGFLRTAKVAIGKTGISDYLFHEISETSAKDDRQEYKDSLAVSQLSFSYLKEYACKRWSRT